MVAFKVWLFVGLGLSLAGGLLVSVEAIKLENLHRLVSTLRNRIEIAFESPLFEVDSPVLIIATDELNRRRGFGQRTGLYVGAHLLSGAALIAIVVATIDGTTNADLAAGLFRWIWHFSVLAVIGLVIVFVFVAYILCYGAGEIVIHGIVTRSIRAMSALLETVERNTPSGVVGVLGAAFLVTGFAAQAVGTALS